MKKTPKKRKGQATSFDTILCLLLIAFFTTLLLTLPSGSQKNTLKNKIRNQYTHSLLLSTMHSTIQDKTIAEHMIIYFSNSTQVNRTFIKEKIAERISLYLNEREWLFYARKEGKEMKIPKGKEDIEGRELSAASMKLQTLDKKETSTYLWIKWS
ncbi:MAG: hypothetical protein B6U72_06590 [Candidatus Altiarchaeales archaeon ex4484_2]|nr:MAG: hypothetical protein B6U72_06590 [Candidatus Altiarchaeales archaeon ex4484_2]